MTEMDSHNFSHFITKAELAEMGDEGLDIPGSYRVPPVTE